ncbi:MAG: hypothetical protein V2I67_15270 [Thermoanaerobaculales bacterium]|jgi:hypothetical protein|nr:hypothetical protein [Thermoanaerobaculales bacterium]
MRHTAIIVAALLAVTGVALADGGVDCATAPTVNLPGSLPYIDSGTTCGKGNTYPVNPCTSYYAQGEDAIYVLEVATPGDYDIALTGTLTWTAFMVTDGCPDTSPACTGSAEGSAGNPSATVTFPAAGTYYLQIDTWPSPACTPYSLSIVDPVPVELQSFSIE